MQTNEMVEKKRVKWDGVEIQGLVSVDEIVREKRTVEVPSFRRIRDIQSGIEKLPQITFTYKLERDTETLKFFEKFFDDNEVKDCEIMRTDAHGVEFSRKSYTGCEVLSITEPAYDAANPVYSQISIIISAYNIITIS